LRSNSAELSTEPGLKNVRDGFLWDTTAWSCGPVKDKQLKLGIVKQQDGAFLLNAGGFHLKKEHNSQNPLFGEPLAVAQHRVLTECYRAGRVCRTRRQVNEYKMP
jgi:hypothetical protein